MFPGVLAMQPDMASSLLAYRLEHLAGANTKAKSYNPPYDGVMFPWESAVTGQETSPAPYGTLEIHVSGDIAFAVWQYWMFTGTVNSNTSMSWLENTAWPILSGIADFWTSKLRIDNPQAKIDAEGFLVQKKVCVYLPAPSFSPLHTHTHTHTHTHSHTLSLFLSLSLYSPTISLSVYASKLFLSLLIFTRSLTHSLAHTLLQIQI